MHTLRTTKVVVEVGSELGDEQKIVSNDLQEKKNSEISETKKSEVLKEGEHIFDIIFSYLSAFLHYLFIIIFVHSI